MGSTPRVSITFLIIIFITNLCPTRHLFAAEENKGEKSLDLKYALSIGPLKISKYANSTSISLSIVSLFDVYISNVNKEEVRSKLPSKTSNAISSNFKGYDTQFSHEYYQYRLSGLLTPDLIVPNGRVSALSFLNNSIPLYDSLNSYSEYYEVRGGTDYTYYSGWGGTAGYEYTINNDFTSEIKYKYLKYNILNFEYVFFDEILKVACFFNLNYQKFSYSNSISFHLYEQYSYYGGEPTQLNTVYNGTHNIEYTREVSQYCIGFSFNNTSSSGRLGDYWDFSPLKLSIGLYYQQMKYSNLVNCEIYDNKINSIGFFFNISIANLEFNIYDFK
ncbi:MAG TPA: hypothetical protein PKM65_09350 [Spirochaetota bacterium]|nr:hypothetical protein [Spirochaetota bacterium]HNT12765.1 hypothetical protein [Spirochaetota bacterium]